jgi:phosphatidylglycerol:prolipoprotein diacylglycerol transferase
MRFSAFGVCTVVGLLAAFSLMRWTATMAGVAREPLFDAGWFGVLAGLVFSRLLLILHEPTAFLHYPLLVLSLPSFTYVGMGLTVAAVVVYLRRKGLPLAKVLDAWAPCAALLAAALSVGYFIEGTHAGMPTALPWGVLDPRFGRVHPVQMYDAVAAMWICAGLLFRLARPHPPGNIAQNAFAAGGILYFLLDMLRQPDPDSSHAFLEPSQWIALAAYVAGVVWMARSIAARDKLQDSTAQVRAATVSAHESKETL